MIIFLACDTMSSIVLWKRISLKLYKDFKRYNCKGMSAIVITVFLQLFLLSVYFNSFYSAYLRVFQRVFR